MAQTTKKEKSILLLSNNDNAKAFASRLRDAGCRAIIFHDPISTDVVGKFSPDLVVSYNYVHIVKEDVINLLGDKIVNMHTSYLPWNKGASPNLWSFIDDTPKGVTIHRLEKGLDTGKIMFQKEVVFDEDTETLASSYQKLQTAIVDLFMEHLKDILSGDFQLAEQMAGGSYHRTSDLEELLGDKKIDYHMTIAEFRRFLSN